MRSKSKWRWLRMNNRAVWAHHVWERVWWAWVIVHGRYQATSTSMLRKMTASMTQRGGDQVHLGSPAERKPCPCGLTLSVSFKHFIGCVKHLSLWGLWRWGRKGGRKEGREWTGKLTGQFSRVTAVYLPYPWRHLYPSPNVTCRDFVQLTPKKVTHPI